jgi:hypothetical protein
MQFDRSATPAGIVLQFTPGDIERLPNQQPEIFSRRVDLAFLGQARFFAPAFFGAMPRRVIDDDLVARHGEIDSHLEPVAVKVVMMRDLDQHTAGEEVRAIRQELVGSFADIFLDSVDGLEISKRDVYW